MLARRVARRLSSSAATAAAPAPGAPPPAGLFSWLSPSGRELGTALSAVALVFSAGLGAARLLYQKEAAIAALEERVRGLERAHAAAWAGAEKEYRALLAGAKGEFEAKLAGAGLSAEVAALRVLKDYAVSVAGGEASRDSSAAGAPPPRPSD
jgi:hypothetical protein